MTIMFSEQCMIFCFINWKISHSCVGMVSADTRKNIPLKYTHRMEIGLDEKTFCSVKNLY